MLSFTDIRAKVASPLTPYSTNRRILRDNDPCTRATFVVCYGYVERFVLQIVYINEFVMCKPSESLTLQISCNRSL